MDTPGVVILRQNGKCVWIQAIGPNTGNVEGNHVIARLMRQPDVTHEFIPKPTYAQALLAEDDLMCELQPMRYKRRKPKQRTNRFQQRLARDWNHR